MTESMRKFALTTLGSLKQRVEGQPGFETNQKLKALYVIVSTAEGAVAFDNCEELARVCAEFARKKATEMGDDDNNSGHLNLFRS